MEIITFKSDMQQPVGDFFAKCFSAVGIPYFPKDRHADIADVEQYYMQNGCFWCLYDKEVLIGTVAVRIIDIEHKVIELKRLFALPEYQGKGYGRSLLKYAIDYARKQQYNKICLDTRKQFSAAQHLYRSSGFQEADKYNDNERLNCILNLFYNIGSNDVL